METEPGQRNDHKVRVALLFGGRSTEHSISCITAGSVLAALDPQRYDVVPIGITREGRWVLASSDPAAFQIHGDHLPEVGSSDASVVLAADPKGPVSILADGTRPATFFEPRDGEWAAFARKLTGQALPLPSAATEQATYNILKGLGTARLEKLLSYHIIPGVTLTGALLGPPTISQKTYTTANGQPLTVKSNFGVVTLVDNNPSTADSGIVEAPMNQGNRQIAWSTAVLLPSTY